MVSNATPVEVFLKKSVEDAKSDNLILRWRRLEELHHKKLWHQLTVYFMECLGDKEFLESVTPAVFYKEFISEFEHRVNPVSLVRIAMALARRISDPPEAVAFLDNILQIVKGNPEADILAHSAIIECHLRSTDKNGKCTEMPKIRELVEATETKLEDLAGVTSVHGDFYKVSATYLRESGNFSGYYKEALRYLGCIDVEKLTEEEKHQHALCLALAALLGEDVYNFGQLLVHPVLESLSSGRGGTEYKWLIDVLYAFNSGDLNKFETLRPQWSTQPDLAKNETHLNRKIRLLCLMEMAYIRPANARHIKFSEIATLSKTPPEEVEYLVMRALSLGLVKGSIDQVEERVSLTWVQPRVLDKKQVGAMSARVKDWCRDVEGMQRLSEVEAEEILSH